MIIALHLRVVRTWCIFMTVMTCQNYSVCQKSPLIMLENRHRKGAGDGFIRVGSREVVVLFRQKKKKKVSNTELHLGDICN